MHKNSVQSEGGGLSVSPLPVTVTDGGANWQFANVAWQKPKAGNLVIPANTECERVVWQLDSEREMVIEIRPIPKTSR